jgi:hypothetical protein
MVEIIVFSWNNLLTINEKDGKLNILDNTLYGNSFAH